MNRNRIAVLIVAVLCVGALAVVAGTVDVPRDSQPGTGGGEGGTEPRSDSQDVVTPQEEQGDRVEIPPWLRTVGLALFALSILVAAALTVRNLSKRTATLLVVTVIVVMIVGSVIMAILLEFAQDAPSPQEQAPAPAPSENETGSPGEADRESDRADQEYDIPLVLLGLFGLVALAAVGAIARFSGSEESVAVPASVEEDVETESERIREVAEAAGRAADQLEDDGDVENTVYRAWREMTDALSVDDPRTTTPGEFADVAVEAGMDEADVEELTWLFTEVRYGDAAVTEERERRAKQALRRIEDTYAEEGIDVEEAVIDGGETDE